MPDTAIPQDRYYAEKYTNSSFTAYNDTDYLQVMALATKVITDDILGAVDTSFSVMYTPISAAEVYEYGHDGLSSCIAIVFELIAMCIGFINMASDEPHEDMIELMMKRLGVQRSVLVTRDLIMSFTYVLIFALLTGIAFWGVIFTSSISIGIIIIMVIFNVIQVTLRQIVFNYTLPR